MTSLTLLHATDRKNLSKKAESLARMNSDAIVIGGVPEIPSELKFLTEIGHSVYATPETVNLSNFENHVFAGSDSSIVGLNII